jgi:hypothetical protein
MMSPIYQESPLMELSSQIPSSSWVIFSFLMYVHKGAFTPNFKLVLSENLGGVLGGTQC